MGLDVLEGRAGQRDHLSEGARLVDHVVAHFLRVHVHAPAAETHEVGQPRVRSNGHAVPEGELDRRPHYMRVAAVEAGGDVGRGDEGHDFGVRAERPAPVALAHVAVEVDRPRGHATALSSTPSSAVMNRSISASVIASEHAPRPRWLNRTPSFRSPMNTRSGAAGSLGRLDR